MHEVTVIVVVVVIVVVTVVVIVIVIVIVKFEKWNVVILFLMFEDYFDIHLIFVVILD